MQSPQSSPGSLREYDPTGKTAQQYVSFKLRLASENNGVSYPNRASSAKSLLRPKFAGGQRQFVSENNDGDWQSHVVARVSPNQRDNNDCPIGMLGFFESINSLPAAQRCLNGAVDWLRGRGCQLIVGPINGDTWHEYRLNVGPWDDPLFLSEPSNPDFYSALWSESGFRVRESYHSKIVSQIDTILPVVQPSLDAAVASGYQFRMIDLDRFDSELDTIYDLSIVSFANNFLYEPITRDEFKQLYRSARSVVDKDLVWFALDKNDMPVGFLFCIIDYRIAFDAMKGRRNLLSKLRFLLNKCRASSVNFKSICVLPEHRQNSVAAALMCKGYQSSVRKGFQQANLCLIKDGNPSTKLDGGHSRIMRRYNLYEFPT